MIDKRIQRYGISNYTRSYFPEVFYDDLPLVDEDEDIDLGDEEEEENIDNDLD